MKERFVQFEVYEEVFVVLIADSSLFGRATSEWIVSIYFDTSNVS